MQMRRLRGNEGDGWSLLGRLLFWAMRRACRERWAV
jgi:hypothetical protein